MMIGTTDSTESTESMITDLNSLKHMPPGCLPPLPGHCLQLLGQ